jgi:hypothetical protein
MPGHEGQNGLGGLGGAEIHLNSFTLTNNKNNNNNNNKAEAQSFTSSRVKKETTFWSNKLTSWLYANDGSFR